MIFWGTALALALIVAALIAAALMFEGGPRGTGPAAGEASDLNVYRDQLAAVDRDVARAVVTPDEAERLRNEIKRRLLEADRRTGPAERAAPKAANLAVVAGAVLVVTVGSVLIYRGLGAPGYPDLPLATRIEAARQAAATRPDQTTAEARATPRQPRQPSSDFVDLMERLRHAVETRPGDIQGLRLLARNEAGLGNYADAAAAQGRLVEALGDAAEASDHAALAELRLLAADGAVTPAARQAMADALALDPDEPTARYFQHLIDASDGPIPLPGALARSGDLVAAHAAQTRLIDLLGERAQASDYTDLADLMILAAGGYVSPQAEAILNRALQMDPRNGTAQYYIGLIHAQTGRADLAFRIWEGLLRSSPAGAPWRAPIEAQIEAIAAEAGVDYRLTDTPGAAPPGPDAGQIADAAAMSPAERMQMIEGMVSGLSERLATEGGPPDDWARLIRAYGVLGRIEAAAAVWAEAQKVFPDDAARVPILQAARDAGVAQ